MNYQKLYNQIVEKAKSENRKKNSKIYYEAHHILPLCLGGTGNTKQWRWHTNIVLLTAREHFLCHWLLHEIYPDNEKLSMAFFLMCSIENDKQRRYKPSSRIIEYAKKQSSKFRKNQKGFWKGKHLSEETKNKIRLANLGKKQSDFTKNKRLETFKNIGLHDIISKRLKGKSLTEEHKNKIKASSQRNQYKHSEEIKEKLRKPKKTIQCPVCNKVGGIPQMKRWHFEFCKLNQK